MTNNQKLVRYCLTVQGEIPDYILTETYGGLSGQFGIETNNRPWPQNLEVIGVTKKDIQPEEFDTILQVFETSNDLFYYLSSLLDDKLKTIFKRIESTVEDVQNPGETIVVTNVVEEKVPYNIQEEVDLIWNKYLEISTTA